MMNIDDLNSRRTRMQESMQNQVTKQNEENKIEIRQQAKKNTPEIFTNIVYTPAFLKTQIGKLMSVEFLIGTNNIVNKIGFLEDVGESYILLKSFEGNSLIYADLNSIKFITISTPCYGMPNFQNFNNMQNINSNFNRY